MRPLIPELCAQCRSEWLVGSYWLLRREHPEPEPEPEPEVVVDVAQATITTRRAVVKGRSIACALLACLVDARGEVVPPDVLYRAAWEATEYHPLRDRNRLYVALKRLRTTLTELCGDDRGELIETRSGGWRLVAGVVVRKTR